MVAYKAYAAHAAVCVRTERTAFVSFLLEMYYVVARSENVKYLDYYAERRVKDLCYQAVVVQNAVNIASYPYSAKSGLREWTRGAAWPATAERGRSFLSTELYEARVVSMRPYVCPVQVSLLSASTLVGGSKI